MSLKSVESSYGTQGLLNEARTLAGKNAPQPGALAGDTVRLSNQGRLMSSLTARIAPTPRSAENLADALAADLRTLMRQHAIDPRSGAAFAVNADTGEVGISGASPQARRMAAMIENHPDIEARIRDIALLNRHLAAADQSATYSLATQVASNASRVDAFADTYDFLAGDAAAAFSPIAAQPAAGYGQARRALASYAAVSGAPGASADLAVVFNGSEVRVRAN